jgi:NADH:ubiquinone oxidoreductase subunit C
MLDDAMHALAARFKYLEGHITCPRQRRMFVTIPQEHFLEVFDYIVKALGFSHLCGITGLDEGAVFSALYHCVNKEGAVLTAKTSVPRTNPVLKTIMPYFPGGEIYERELMDLFGMTIDSLPPGPRYPLPDDWPRDEFPLRKDWHPKANKQEKGE